MPPCWPSCAVRGCIGHPFGTYAAQRQPRIASAVAERLGIPAAAVRDGLDSRIGDSGAAHAPLMLAHALEQAKAGDLIRAVGFGQGADALVFRATGAAWSGAGVETALAAGRVESGYGRFAALTGSVERDEGMRAELDLQTPMTVLHRKRDMLLGLVGGCWRATPTSIRATCRWGLGCAWCSASRTTTRAGISVVISGRPRLCAAGGSERWRRESGTRSPSSAWAAPASANAGTTAPRI
ncbi:hypothetical protein EJ913_18175 [Azospirillum doebereinerae]|uniref:Beta-ketoacyl-[acyl-carrier-protein] synthase III C-terminal domain-containing protein n=1 Tax=Azospirillum doebereinerae TaxID=92933 RepID=A0A3S0VH59_9PROT|nr:hypothetical protein EJ913_18175 [Azospirillum doebereinerae]